MGNTLLTVGVARADEPIHQLSIIASEAEHEKTGQNKMKKKPHSFWANNKLFSSVKISVRKAAGSIGWLRMSVCCFSLDTTPVAPNKPRPVSQETSEDV